MWLIATQIEKEVTFLCGETICYNLFITLQSKNPEYFVPPSGDGLFIHKLKETTSGFHISMNERSK